MLWAYPGTASARGYECGTDHLCYSHAEEVMEAGGSGELKYLMQQSDVFRFEL